MLTVSCESAAPRDVVAAQVVAANNAGTCYVWRMMRGATASTHFEPLHKLKAHNRAPAVPAGSD